MTQLGYDTAKQLLDALRLPSNTVPCVIELLTVGEKKKMLWGIQLT